MIRTILASMALTLAGVAHGASIPMYDFPLKNGESRPAVYKMSEHPNSVFVFEAYRLSCGYCNENAPLVDALTDDFRAESRVQILDLGQDTTDADYEEWITRHHPNHPVIADTGRRVYSALKSQNGVPQAFVVNCKGALVGSVLGSWEPGDASKMRRMVNEALKTTCK